MPSIHPTAIISPEADIAPSAVVGPQCVLTGPIKLADDVRLIAGVYLQGPLSIGPRSVVYPGAALGFEPQDYKFKPGSPTPGVVVGADCILREHATLHAATGDAPTRIGDRVFMMVGSHAGHDVTIGNNVILINHAGLAGHCEVGDNAILSGSVVVHQFVRIGRLAMLSGGSGCSSDIPPFCILNGRNRLGGVNVVGMRRASISRDEISAVRTAYREIFRRSIPRPEMIEMLTERGRTSPCVMEMAEFVRHTKRGICPGHTRLSRGGDAIEDPDPPEDLF